MSQEPNGVLSIEPNGVMPTVPSAEIPNLPCPNCGENLLTEGFYNYCSETTRLREDNYTHVSSHGILYIDHDEKGHETVDHECDMEACCGSCETELPWALYQLRALDGENLADLPSQIAALLAELNDVPAPPPPTGGTAVQEQRA